MTPPAGMPDPLPVDSGPPGGEPGRAHAASAPAEASGLHDPPSAAQLLEAVREFLERDVMGATEGRVMFHTRVSVNVLAMVERELALGAAQAAAHTRRLEALGMGSDAELSAAVRSGAMDARMAEVRASVRADVADKLAVANPRHARQGGRTDPKP